MNALSPSSSGESGQSGGSPQSTPESGLRPTRQPVPSTSEVGLIVNSDTFVNLESALEGSKDDIDSKLFLYQTPAFQWIPSSVYKYADFMESLYIMATQGVAGKKFYIGEDGDDGHIYGLVNIAAFFAQSMKETIQVCVAALLHVDDNVVQYEFFLTFTQQLTTHDLATMTSV